MITAGKGNHCMGTWKQTFNSIVWVTTVSTLQRDEWRSLEMWRLLRDSCAWFCVNLQQALWLVVSALQICNTNKFIFQNNVYMYQYSSGYFSGFFCSGHLHLVHFGLLSTKSSIQLKEVIKNNSGNSYVVTITKLHYISNSYFKDNKLIQALHTKPHDLSDLSKPIA